VLLGTDKLGIYLKETSNDIKNIIDVVKSAQKPPDGTTSTNNLSPEAQSIKEAVNTIINFPTENNKIVPATKQAAVSTATLMQQAKDLAQNTQDRNKQVAILRTAKALAQTTTDLAKAAKAPKDRQGINNLVKAANDLLNHTMQLEGFKSENTGLGSGSQVPPSAANQLLSVAKVLASSANNFLNSVGQLIQNPKDSSSSALVTQASKQYSDAIRDMFHTTQQLNPGVMEINRNVWWKNFPSMSRRFS